MNLLLHFIRHSVWCATCRPMSGWKPICTWRWYKGVLFHTRQARECFVAEIYTKC